MDIDHLTGAPFNLDHHGLTWVERTFRDLAPDERLRQLFVLRAGLDEAGFAALKAFAPGGITAVYDHNHQRERRHVADLVATAKVPPLVSADLEGSRMSLPFGAEVPNPLALAAIDDVAATREISRIMAEEAVAAGINWSFTPVIDVNQAWRSAIVATRGFGSDVERITRHALAQIGVFQKHGIAATVKHWPGEGYDDRDQHLVTTVNPLSVAGWEEVFGRLYGAAIKAGVMSVMSAHIALPSYVRAADPPAAIEAYRPASVSKLLTTDLLRGKLGFNGLIVSDATPMAGFGSWAPRHIAVPDCLAAGCDVILFSNDAEADFGFIKAALADGRLTQARLDDAAWRVLGMKAALGLHKGPRAVMPVKTEENRHTAMAITRRAPTLVKDTQNLLPLDPVRHRRVLIVTPGIGMPWSPEPLPFVLPQLLAKRGFEITMHRPETVICRAAFDLVLYLFGDETLIGRNRIFLDWLKLGGGIAKSMQRTWHDIPTLMISFGYPYMVYDAPRMPTVVNAYATMDTMQEAVAEALLGNIAWNRSSPVDAFCELEDARY